MTPNEPKSDTPRTDAETFDINSYDYSRRDLVDADFARTLERELQEANNMGQEVHDYLVSINPDNQHLSVLEAIIQQRGIENELRQRITTAKELIERLVEALKYESKHAILCEIGWEALQLAREQGYPKSESSTTQCPPPTKPNAT